MGWRNRTSSRRSEGGRRGLSSRDETEGVSAGQARGDWKITTDETRLTAREMEVRTRILIKHPVCPVYAGRGYRPASATITQLSQNENPAKNHSTAGHMGESPRIKAARMGYRQALPIKHTSREWPMRSRFYSVGAPYVVATDSAALQRGPTICLVITGGGAPHPNKPGTVPNRVPSPMQTNFSEELGYWDTKYVL